MVATTERMGIQPNKDNADRVSGQVDAVVMPKLEEIFESRLKRIVMCKEMAKKEAQHKDSLYDIKNNDLSREDLWKSAFLVGALTIIEGIEA